MNWSTSMTGGALKFMAGGGTAAGTLGAATTGATGSGAGLFLGGRGMAGGCVMVVGAGGVGGFGDTQWDGWWRWVLRWVLRRAMVE
jgi:hypothetical protein